MCLLPLETALYAPANPKSWKFPHSKLLEHRTFTAKCPHTYLLCMTFGQAGLPKQDILKMLYFFDGAPDIPVITVTPKYM